MIGLPFWVFPHLRLFDAGQFDVAVKEFPIASRAFHHGQFNFHRN